MLLRPWALLLAAGGICFSVSGAATAAVTWPPGFDEEVVVDGLDQPTAFAFAADGRIFIAEKRGRVRIVTAAGQLLPTPFATVSVNTQNDRGLIGIALHPSFPGTPYVYLAYTTNIVPANPANSYSRIHRITRMTANGDVAVPWSEVMLIDNIPSDIDSHTGGSLQFGPDGKLYVSTGDGASYNFADPLALRALDLDQPVGKILRINPDGSAPIDNPFYTTPAAIRSRVWQYGLRNPFKTTFRPVTGSLYVEDVGWDTWEEVNVGGAGASFGWPCFEGNNPQPVYQSSFPGPCATAPSTQPVYAYSHGGGDSAITGGAFFGGGNYPSQYVDRYFVADYARHWIKYLTLTTADTFVSIADFASGDSQFTPVDLALAPEGNLQYLNIAADFALPSGSLSRIVYVGAGNHAPRLRASATPTSGYASLIVSFTAAGTTDADNDPLTYHWRFGDGSEADGFNAGHTYTANGTYLATLQVSDGSVTREAKVRITVGSLPPTATILTPPSYQTFEPGETVLFSGSATDPDDGALGPAALLWTVILHHQSHLHPYQDSTGSNGSFVTVSHGATGDLVAYELVLTATDSTGLSDTQRLLINKNQPPVANAGPDQVVPCLPPGPTVSLNGTLSSDPDNQPITYSWVQTSGPPVSLTGASTSSPSFTAPSVPGGTTLTFGLTVSDSHVTSADSVAVTVPSPPPGETGLLLMDVNNQGISWSSLPGASSYDLLRGSLTPSFAYNHSCLISGLVNASTSDAALPSIAAGFYYLSRAVNGCGVGTLGSASNGTPRPNPPCP